MEATGKVKWFEEKKNYGYIAVEDGKGDVFVHHSDIVADEKQPLLAGEKVKFELGETPYGRRALRVRRTE